MTGQVILHIPADGHEPFIASEVFRLEPGAINGGERDTIWTKALGFPLSDFDGRQAGDCLVELEDALESIRRSGQMYRRLRWRNGILECRARARSTHAAARRVSLQRAGDSAGDLVTAVTGQAVESEYAPKHVLVTPELLPQLKEWSEPLHVRVTEDDGAVLTMEFRRPVDARYSAIIPGTMVPFGADLPFTLWPSTRPESKTLDVAADGTPAGHLE